MLAKSLNERKNIWKSTYKVVVLTAHGVRPASDIDHVDGRAVDTKDYINAIDNHAEEGEEGRARSRRGLKYSKQARTLSRTKEIRIRTGVVDLQDWRSPELQELAGVDVDAGCKEWCN